ncbi:hypothetical protein EJ02DRAFT_450630 [Clathrospora elynae]|uniref:Uncharacterized protein n=1 Tax=Clathrospora elynae TaxID=706981 RepID=A0A6A5T3T1_9PLEO|nr:hypothetical protein EJ02DRAFT_450630 [Clathrospora elynae]
MAWQCHFHLYSDPTNRRVPDRTRANERTVKNGLALLPLPPLPHHNDSYP